jgi:hypothetical protein
MSFPWSSVRFSFALAGMMAAAVVACSSGGSGGTSPTSSTMTTGGCVDPTALPVADSVEPGDAGSLEPAGPIFDSAFANYTSWKSWDFSSSQDAGPHEAGGLTAWINKVPPPGSKEFPIGTIIVKRINSIPQTFAMEKRGPDANQPVNSGGATNWEFFELQTDCDGKTVSHIWRGYGPPIAESYGGDPQACNGCHVNFAGNDFVASTPLQLENF